MRLVSSLTNRIFLACALVAALSLGFAFYFVNARATREAEAELERELTDAASLVDQHRATLTDTLTRMARLVADLPRLKAAVDTADPPTVQHLADDYLGQVDADFFTVTGADGRLLAGGDLGGGVLGPEAAASVDEVVRFVSHPRGILQIVSVPIFVLADAPDVLGRLTVGFFLDDALARQFRAATGSEIAFGADGRIVAASLPSADRQRLSGALRTSGIGRVSLADDDYMTLARSLAPVGASDSRAARPMILTLRSRSERLRVLSTLRTGLGAALVLTVVLATMLSYAVATTMTRPLAAVTRAMRDVATTGDLTRKVLLRSRAWDDEDARLLASAFNTLTESIARFQRDAAQRERLSSLGRLSTVIAHEVRNPLMIISASLATLRRPDVSDLELREAIADIEGETKRINRVVADVLDFARPIRFERGAADVNAICRDAVAAVWIDTDTSPVLDLDPSLPSVDTDAERMRTALVNVLSNARHAVEAREIAVDASADAHPVVTVTTRRDGPRVIIQVADRGIGIDQTTMAHVFDPYFTTRRSGTGLGLPISRNIVEGLGGTIAIASTPGSGTTLRLSLPIDASETRA